MTSCDSDPNPEQCDNIKDNSKCILTQNHQGPHIYPTPISLGISDEIKFKEKM